MTESKGSSGVLLSIRAFAICFVLSIIAAAIAYGVGHTLTKTYQDSGTIRVASPTQSGISDPSVTASNDLTSQYVQLVGSNPVAAIAAKQLGVSASSMHDQLSGSSVAGENVLQVTGSGSTSAQAVARTEAGVRAVQIYLIQVTTQQNKEYSSRLISSILAAQGGTRDAPLSPAKSAQAAATRDNAVYEALRDAAGNQPTFQLVNLTSGSASQVAPKPKLYAIVAFVVVLLLSLRLAFVMRKPKLS